MLGVSATLAFFLVVLGVHRLSVDGVWSRTLTLGAIALLLVLAAPAFMRLTRSATPPGVGLALCALLLLPVGAHFNGGLTSGFAYWFPCVPLLAAALVGPRAALPVGLALVAIAFGLHGLHTGPTPPPIPTLPLHDRALVGVLGMTSATTILAWLYERSGRRKDARLQVALRRERAQAAALARSNAELRQLAHVASHDLKEPLRTIASYLGLLERRYADELDEEGFRYITAASTGAARMHDLLTGLLDYSEAGRREASPAEVSVRAAAEGAWRALAGAPGHDDAELVLADDLPTVTAWVGALGHTFERLFANSLQYRGDRPARVEVTAERGQEEWVVRVADRGVGIEPNLIDRIWVIFTRLDRETARAGVGLAVCKKLIELQGGRIWVESIVGEGSTFSFTLPDSPPPR